MVLLTPKTLKGIIRVFDLGRRLGCHPYEWNKNTQQADISRSLLRKGVWVFNVLLCFGYYAFITFQWHQVTSSEWTSEAQKMFIRFALVFYSFPVFFQLALVNSKEELPEFFNSYLRYNKEFEGRYIPVNSQPKILSTMCEYITVYVYSSFWVDFFAIVTMAFFRPNSPDQISTLLVSTTMLDPRRLALYALFAYHIACYVVNACLLIFTSFGFFFSAFQILQEFGTTPVWLKQKDSEVLIRVYKILFVQIKAVDRVYHIIIAAAKIILMLLSVFCAYGGIRLNGLLAVTLGVIGASTTTFLVVIMSAWSEFDEISQRALADLVRASSKQCGLRQKILRREIRSLRLLQIPVLGMYVIDKPLVLYVMKVVCEGIIFLLVNY